MKLKALTFLTVLLLFCLYTACQEACAGSPEACFLEPAAGPCRAYIPKYYFDQEAQECKEFIWGGCEGVVPFDSLEECQVCECT